MQKVRWKGYSEKYDSWEPMGNLSNVKHLVDKYNTNFNKEKGNSINKNEKISLKRKRNPEQNAKTDD